VAVTNDTFLKAYFSKVIEAPELQTEVRGFLKDTSTIYIEGLEDIHANYRAQVTGEDIRGVPGGETNSTITALARRGTIKETKSSKEEETERIWKYAPFPDNVGKLIPTEYYSQFEK